MTFLKSVFPHLSQKKPTPIAATSTSLDAWCRQSHTQPARSVHKVELCTALAAGREAWGSPVSDTHHHHHTLLRVSLVPAPGVSEDTLLLIERVLSTGGAHHSVTPIADEFSRGGTLFHPDVHDRVCVSSSDGPSTALAARHLEVERTLAFGGGGASGPHLTLAQLAPILDFVSRTTTWICAGGDCKFQSRSFAFTCLAALAPSLPPPSTSVGKASGGANAEDGTDVVDDWVFELSAEAFLGQVPWLVKDPASMQALELIGALKDGPRERATARLYH